MSTLPFGLIIGPNVTKTRLIKLATFANQQMAANISIGPPDNKDSIRDALYALDWESSDVDPIILKGIMESLVANQDIDLLTEDQHDLYLSVGIKAYFKLPQDQEFLWYLKTIEEDLRFEMALKQIKNVDRIRQIQYAQLKRSNKNDLVTSTSTSTSFRTNDLPQIMDSLLRTRGLELSKPDPNLMIINSKGLKQVISDASDVLLASRHLTSLVKNNGVTKTLAQKATMNWLQDISKSTQTIWSSLSGNLDQHAKHGCKIHGTEFVHSKNCKDNTEKTTHSLENFFRESAEPLVRALHFASEVFISRSLVSKTDITQILRTGPRQLSRNNKSNYKSANGPHKTKLAPQT